MPETCGSSGAGHNSSSRGPGGLKIERQPNVGVDPVISAAPRRSVLRAGSRLTRARNVMAARDRRLRPRKDPVRHGCRASTIDQVLKPAPGSTAHDL